MSELSNGINKRLLPYQVLVLWGLWAILVCFDQQMDLPAIVKKIKNILYEGAASGFVIGSVKDKLFNR